MTVFHAAIDIGGSSIKGMLVRPGPASPVPEPIVTGSVVTQISEGARGIIARAIGLIEELISRAGLARQDLLGIGVSSFGFIDAARGVGIKSLRLDIEGFPYVALLEAHFGVPAVIDNDARMAVLGEMRFGSARGYRNVVQFTIGTALATGMVVDGRLVRGRDNVAGEVSHFVIQTEGGITCSCGRGGCARSYISAVALRRHMTERMQEDPGSLLWTLCGGRIETVEPAMLPEAIAAGDASAIAVRDRLVRYLGSLTISVIIMLNPEIVLIGGGISKMDDHLMLPLRQTLREAIFHPVHDCPVVRSGLGASSGMYGALAGIREHLEDTGRAAARASTGMAAEG